MTEEPTPDPNPIVARIRMHQRFFHRTAACFREDDAGYRPSPGMLTAAGHILHAAGAMELFLSSYGRGFPRFAKRSWRSRRGTSEWIGSERGFADMGWTAQSSTNPAADNPASRTISAALAGFDGTVDLLVEVFGDLSAEELARPVQENPMMPPFFTGHHVLEIVLDHTAHHRGALAQYARLLGHEPSIPYFEMNEALHEAQVGGAPAGGAAEERAS